MRTLRRGAVAVGVVGLVLSAGAAGFGGSAVKRSSERRPTTACVALDASYDLLEAHPQGVSRAFWEAAERVALSAQHCDPED
jgi:hypothetical protein